ncbi:MAG: YabP/YqfC family sporulation protein [Clostridia bacterium]
MAPKKEKVSEFEKKVLGRYSLLTIVGNSELLVEGLRGILDYNSETFRVNTVSGIIIVTGSGLEISALTSEEVTLKGKISSIEFCI